MRSNAHGDPIDVRSDWSMFRFSSARAGFNRFEQILSPENAGDLQLAWAAETAGIVFTSSPAIWHGRAFVGDFDGTFYAFDAATGQPLWSAPTSGGVFSSPAVALGRVFVKSEDSILYAFDAASGNLTWSRDVGWGSTPPRL